MQLLALIIRIATWFFWPWKKSYFETIEQPGIEPGTFVSIGESANHYTTRIHWENDDFYTIYTSLHFFPIGNLIFSGWHTRFFRNAWMKLIELKHDIFWNIMREYLPLSHSFFNYNFTKILCYKPFKCKSPATILMNYSVAYSLQKDDKIYTFLDWVFSSNIWCWLLTWKSTVECNFFTNRVQKVLNSDRQG